MELPIDKFDDLESFTNGHTVVELKEIARKFGISPTGSKAQLAGRIWNSLLDNEPAYSQFLEDQSEEEPLVDRNHQIRSSQTTSSELIGSAIQDSPITSTANLTSSNTEVHRANTSSSRVLENSSPTETEMLMLKKQNRKIGKSNCTTCS